MSETTRTRTPPEKRALGSMVAVDPESLPFGTKPDFSFHYIDISAATNGRLFIPDAPIEYRDAPSRARRVIKVGDVLMSTVRPNLKAFAYCDLPAGNYIASTGFAALRALGETDPRYVLYAILSDDVSQQINSLTVGSNYPAINSSDVRRLKIPAFAPAEQRRIAEILSTLDEAIEQTEALIAKMQQVKAGLMHDLFTRGVTPDGRLRPTREQAPELYKESQIGWIPKEWEVEKLGNILRRCGGYLQTGPFGSQLHAHEYQVEGVPVVMPQDINDGMIETQQIARIHEGRANELARHRMRTGDIVIARRGDLSRAASISETEQGWVCGTGCFLLRLGQSALGADFAAYVYRQDFLQRQIAGKAVGTTMPSLNNSVMAGLFFPFCDEEEQTRVVERLDEVEQRIRTLGAGLFLNQKIKQGLMHDLLTGHCPESTAKRKESQISNI